MVTFSNGSATLNGVNFISGSVVNKTGSYTLILKDAYGNKKTISFSVKDTSFPVVSGVINGEIYNSRSLQPGILFDKGTATLNGNNFTSGTPINATGNYTLIVTTNNSTTIDFAYIKYGDVSGDGNINVLDLVLTKRHLLKMISLSGVFFKAGDVSDDGRITICDLLNIKKCILGLNSF